MAKLKSASPPIPNAFSLLFKHSFLHKLTITVYLLSSIAKSNGFDPLILLPSSGLSRNRPSSSTKTVVLNIDKFGAKGDGITDDSKVLICFSFKDLIFLWHVIAFHSFFASCLNAVYCHCVKRMSLLVLWRLFCVCWIGHCFNMGVLILEEIRDD